VNVNEREEIAASVAAHAELGSRYDGAVAEGLVERIGDEIDRRIDERLGAGQRPEGRGQGRGRAAGFLAAAASGPAAEHRHGPGFWGVILGLGSMGIAAGATSVATSHHANSAAQFFMVLLIWTAIAVVNVTYARRR
jgi:hypothetical protein